MIARWRAFRAWWQSLTGPRIWRVQDRPEAKK
jgi:hypothetical protein